MRNPEKPTIGLMLVVRNEYPRIRECIEWHAPYVDQISACDQSSDDGTFEELDKIFTELKIPCTLWQDKNHGYCEPSKQKTADNLNTDWILYVDPDEKFPKEFLETMHDLVKNTKFDGFSFPRNNIFQVKVYNDDVPIEPKWLTVQHPSRDYQLRLTRKEVSTFPQYLHHRVRIYRNGKQNLTKIRYAIDHVKRLDEQWNDNQRYARINNGND